MWTGIGAGGFAATWDHKVPLSTLQAPLSTLHKLKVSLSPEALHKRYGDESL